MPAGSFSAITSGRYHTYALASDGSIACWGDNRSGQGDAPSGQFTAVAAGDLQENGGFHLVV